MAASVSSSTPSLLRVTKGDFDGFFGLFVDNLLQLLLIYHLCPVLCGMTHGEVTSKILPGAAVSILVGNFFYAWQAWRLAKREGRDDVTAMPYGINTVSLFAYIVFIMAPIYRQTGDASLAWKAGLFACFISGVMEFIGAAFGRALRAHAPRAALLSSLAGIAVTFIAMGFVFQLFAMPAVGVLPMLLILFCYAARLKLPLGLPAGFVAVLLGTALAWVLRSLGLAPDWASGKVEPIGLHLPHWSGGDLFGFLTSEVGWSYMAVIFPMGLFNIIGSLQCLESAEAAGDKYDTAPSLVANGIGSIVSACLGSPFATTLYIGHPGWKAMGARWAYSWMNGVVICALALLGAAGHVLQVVPLEATLGILLWIGIVMTAQAFQASPRPHALAVAMGLIPSLAAWLLVQVETTLRVAGTDLASTADKFAPNLYVYGVIALSQGFLITSVIYPAVMAFVIDRKFKAAAMWLAAAALFSAVGLIHSYKLTPAGVENHFAWFTAAPAFAIAYLAGAVLLMVMALMKVKGAEEVETRGE
ncbi:NCS2 family permease [Roseimicrobium sp. ORNL1]|uniref:NCS2 family permease n=1 Tax=Roseimicrobium sp. ORNL1 TaxID=2711231 RepID=UPI001F1068C1|nr:NCS2 family permease [Roseimicrobium sp. ORNL1]